MYSALTLCGLFWQRGYSSGLILQGRREFSCKICPSGMNGQGRCLWALVCLLFSPPFFSGLCCLCNQWCCQHVKMAVYCVTVFFSFPRGIYFLLWLKVQMGLFLCHLSACGFYRCLCCFLPQSPISLCSALLPDLHCCDLLYCVVVGMPCVRWTACFSSFPWRGRESSGETVEGFSWPCLNLATGGGTGVFRPLSEQPRAACLFLFASW